MRLTGGQYLSAPSTSPGNAATSREYARDQASVATSAATCGAPRNGLASTAHSPASTARISSRIAIIASQNRSSSPRSSDSVGSTISVPATGNDTVGAWKP